MRRALALAAAVRTRTAPNPWVGCGGGGRRRSVFEGATEPPGGPHAEVVALAAAGDRAAGATLYTTLEPCAHHGPHPALHRGHRGRRGRPGGGRHPRSRSPGVGPGGGASCGPAASTSSSGWAPTKATELLAPYLKHRRTGRPWVVLKLAATLDGRIAAPDGSSRWITGAEARADAHRLRASSDAVLVGAGTVRADDPELTVRTEPDPDRQPLRVVLGQAPAGARVLPAVEMTGELDRRPRRARRPGDHPGPGGRGRPGGPRLPPRRRGRPLRGLPGPGPLRRRRRRPAVRRARARRPWRGSGGAGWSRSPGWATTSASSWKRHDGPTATERAA